MVNAESMRAVSKKTFLREGTNSPEYPCAPHSGISSQFCVVRDGQPLLMSQLAQRKPFAISQTLFQTYAESGQDLTFADVDFSPVRTYRTGVTQHDHADKGRDGDRVE